MSNKPAVPSRTPELVISIFMHDTSDPNGPPLSKTYRVNYQLLEMARMEALSDLILPDIYPMTLMVAAKYLRLSKPVGICWRCGCTERNACMMPEHLGGACAWTDQTKTLCTRCADPAPGGIIKP